MMDGPLKERDWKYMRSIHDEMLHKLCENINRRAVEIVTSGSGNSHEQYLSLYRHIQDSDEIIEVCFNDWKRSRLTDRILFLRRYGLLTDRHVKNLTSEGQAWLKMMEEMGRE
jgi:hypothetical protein